MFMICPGIGPSCIEERGTLPARAGAPRGSAARMLQKTAEHVQLSASPTATATAAPTMALTGKLALVTGASSGIGLAIAKMFVKEGKERA